LEAAPVANGTVLIVEDDFDLREMIEMLLGLEGMRPVGATNGRDALRVLARLDSRPDVILLDLMMPEMSGWQFREAQLAEPGLASIPVIVMSAMTDRGIEGVPFLAKPFDNQQLVDAIRRIVPLRC
jgi:CheY-like chemotaxis protein